MPPPDPKTDAAVVLRHARDTAESGADGEPDRRRAKLHRTWSQRLVLAFNVSVALACFLAATVIWYANDQLGRRKLVDLGTSGVTTVTVPADGSAAPGTDGTATTGAAAGSTPSATSSTFPATVESKAQNFLLTGSDNRSCIDPNSPYAGAFLGSGSDIGERSDTIMILRVDPETHQAAVLSFPRDLWVKISGSNKKSRINAAFDTQDPQKLVHTIEENFLVPVDHYINVDFCAFKDIVDAVGGVSVPFEFAARDKNTGLNITTPECHAFQGDEALAYVRSRHYQWFDAAKNKWVTDGTSDYGRITRQQDFLKRALHKAMDKAARDPLAAKRLIEAATKNVTTDLELTVNTMLGLAGTMQDFDPTKVRTFQVEGRGVKKGNASVIEPILTSDSMVKILDVFRGNARLGDAPTVTTPGDIVTVPGESTTSAPAATTSTVPTVTTPAPGGTTTSAPAVVQVDDTARGIFPPNDPTCH